MRPRAVPAARCRRTRPARRRPTRAAAAAGRCGRPARLRGRQLAQRRPRARRAARPSSAIVTTTRSAMQGAVGVEVAGRDAHVLMRADDEDAAVGGDGRQRRAAPVEEDQVGLERGRQPRRPPSTFETATAPASPPPQRRQPTVGTPATSAVSRWSEAAWRPAPRELEEVVDRRPHARSTSGSGGPPRPIATTTTAARRARAAREVARDGRLADALAGADHRERRRSTGTKRGGSKRKSAPSYGTPSASARLASAKRSRGPSTGSSERSRTTSGACSLDGVLERRHERHAVVASPPRSFSVPPTSTAATTSSAARRGRRGRPAGSAHRRSMATHAPHGRDVTSRSIRPVYFSYSNVSVENWMMRSCPWNGWRRQMSTCVPVTSITL